MTVETLNKCRGKISRVPLVLSTELPVFHPCVQGQPRRGEPAAAPPSIVYRNARAPLCAAGSVSVLGCGGAEGGFVGASKSAVREER